MCAAQHALDRIVEHGRAGGRYNCDIEDPTAAIDGEAHTAAALLASAARLVRIGLVRLEPRGESALPVRRNGRLCWGGRCGGWRRVGGWR